MSSSMQQQTPGLEIQPTTVIQVAPLSPSFEQRMEMSNQLYQQQVDFIRKRLRERYPTYWAIVFSLFVAASSSLLMSLQIILTINTAYALRNGGSGLWAGMLGLCLAIAVCITG